MNKVKALFKEDNVIEISSKFILAGNIGLLLYRLPLVTQLNQHYLTLEYSLNS